VKLLFIFEKIVREIHHLFSRYRILKFIRINSSLIQSLLKSVRIFIKYIYKYIYKNLIDDEKVFENKKERGRVTVVAQFRNFSVSGNRLQLRLQAVVQVPEKKRGTSQIRKQQYVHMARRAGERHVLRSCPHQM